MKKIKLLVTGSAGFIMGNYIRRLIYLNKHNSQYNYIVSSIDCVKSNTINGFYNKNHNFHVADITDKHILDFIFRLERPDVVIHAAALSNKEDLNSHIESNVVGTENILRVCESFGVSKLLYLNNIFNDYENNHNITKTMSDLLIDKERNKNKNLGINEISLPYVYGPRQKSEEVIPSIINCYLNNEEYCVDNKIRDWVHVFDVCSAINLILENRKSDRYQITNNDQMTSSQVLDIIAQRLDFKDYLVNDHFYDKFKVGLTNNKSIMDLGWKPTQISDSNVMILDTVYWYLKNKWALKDD